MNVGKLKTVVTYGDNVVKRVQPDIPDGSYMSMLTDLENLEEKYSHYINKTKVTNISNQSRIGVVLRYFNGNYPIPNWSSIFPVLDGFKPNDEDDSTITAPIVLANKVEADSFALYSRVHELKSVANVFAWHTIAENFDTTNNPNNVKTLGDFLNSEKLIVERCGNKYIYDKMDYVKCDVGLSKPSSFLILYCKPYDIKYLLRV